MLLTIDVGNTNTVLGVFRGEELIANWRLTTARLQTVDEYGVLTRNLFTLAGLDGAAIGGVIISSVVPPMNWTLAEMSRLYFGQKALFVEAGRENGNGRARRQSPGSRRRPHREWRCCVSQIWRSVHRGGFRHRHHVRCDFRARRIFGWRHRAGAWASPPKRCFRARRRLPRVEIKDPGRVIGTNTVTHMQAGLYYGAIDMVDGMLTRIKAELENAGDRRCDRRTSNAGGTRLEADSAHR